MDYLVALDWWHCQLYFANLDLFSCYLLGCGITDVAQEPEYDACPESKDTKVLNMYSIFNLQKPHCE